MRQYTGWEYLLIDVANQADYDKLTFEERIQWATDNLTSLEDLIDEVPAKTRPLYIKAVMAIRKAQKGIATGHRVGLDAACSGMQIMSALTGCVAGATATGLVDPNVRADAYTSVTDAMNMQPGISVAIARSDAKKAVMTSLYGSKAQPKTIFGEDTPELNAFYQAMLIVCPGAWELLQDLLGSWQPWTLAHSWKMPDGFDVVVKVMSKEQVRVEVDELDHATFTYEFYENKGQAKGLSNAANAVHSVDGWVLRSMHRRCNYDKPMVHQAAGLIEIELIERSMGLNAEPEVVDSKVNYYMEQYVRSSLVDAVILPYLTQESVRNLSTEHLQALSGLVQGMLQYEPFEIVTIHDEFTAHPNNCNHMRWVYREILAEVAESNLLNDILSQLYGMPGVFDKKSDNLAELIRESEYALC